MQQLIFSQNFPAAHPKKGERTLFVEKIWRSFLEEAHEPDQLMELNSYIDLYTQYASDNNFRLRAPIEVAPKFHTIRAGGRWKVGDRFIPRVWQGLPYKSKTLQFAPPIEIKKIWRVTITGSHCSTRVVIDNDSLPGAQHLLRTRDVAANDGLTFSEFSDWFSMHPKNSSDGFTGQIICWANKNLYE